jgi:hypothetical protein
MRNVLTNFVEGINHLFYVQKRYLENRGESGKARKATYSYINIVRLFRVACLIPKATNTHS